jgi:hypothetical protein
MVIIALILLLFYEIKGRLFSSSVSKDVFKKYSTKSNVAINKAHILINTLKLLAVFGVLDDFNRASN